MTKPSGPRRGSPAPYRVKIYGNRDGTTLTYPAGVQPPNAPTTLSAGQVVDLGQITNQDFEIKGEQRVRRSRPSPQAAQVIDPGGQTLKAEGDPAQSQPIAVEQYRDKYVFLAPTDYEANYVDIIASASAPR